MKVNYGQFPSIEQMSGQYLNRSAPAANNSEEVSFADILSSKRDMEAGEPLRFSKHASERLSDRNIELSDSQLTRLNEGAQRACEKGINESLVLMDEFAFIVNVKNNTVITAMEKNGSDENVFTNIDGAVIV